LGRHEQRQRKGKEKEKRGKRKGRKGTKEKREEIGKRGTRRKRERERVILVTGGGFWKTLLHLSTQSVCRVSRWIHRRGLFGGGWRIARSVKGGRRTFPIFKTFQAIIQAF